MIKLRLNGVFFDMEGNEEFALSFSASKLQSIESRSGDFSTTFSLPLTSDLATAIGHTNRLDSVSQFPYSDIAAEVFINDILVFNGFAKVVRITDVLELQVYSGNSNWLTLINERRLQEIDLSDLNLTMNATNVQANRLNTYLSGFVFPNAFYGEFADTLNPFTFYDFFPAIYYHRILTQIFADIGWTVDGDLFDDALFRKCVTAFSNDKIGTDNLFQLVDSALEAPPSQVSPAGEYTFYLGFPTATINELGTVTVPSVWTNNPAFAPIVYVHDDAFYDIVGRINWAPTSLANIVSTAVYLTPILNQGGKEVLLNDPNSFALGGFDFGFNSVFIEKGTYALKWVINKGSFPINTFASIFEMTVLSNQNFAYKQNVPEGQTIEMFKALPDISQAEFISTVVNQFNALITTDYISKKATFSKFEAIDLKRSNPLNWTDRVDLSDNLELTFESDIYAQTNWFRYKKDDSDIYGGSIVPQDANFTIVNNNLPLEQDVIELPFAATARPFIQGANLATIPIRLDSVVPRCLVVEITTSNIITMVGQSTPTQSAEMFFNSIRFQALLAAYYPALIRILQEYKLVKFLIRLKANDLVNIDYTRPIFLDFETEWNGQVRGYFYLNFIDQYTGDGSCFVELIKLN
jgi:hypothetical protein